MKRRAIISLDIDHISFENALDGVLQRAIAYEGGFICFVNVHMLIEAHDDPEFAAMVDEAVYALPDGVPVARAFKLLHGVEQERIAGMDFLGPAIFRANREGLNVGFIGSTPEVLEKVKKRILNDYPKVNITAMISPPFGGQWDNDHYVNTFNESGTHLIFVALGCPKQEKWMYRMKDNIHGVMLGIGGALPVFAGEVERAPRWMQDNGLEWLYRLLSEPKRMFRRYFYTNTKFIGLFIKERFMN